MNEIVIDQWYYIGNGHWYIYYDEKTDTLKRTCRIDYSHINNYLFNIVVTREIEHPNFYVNLFDTEYDKIPLFKIVCKKCPNKTIIPFRWKNNVKLYPKENVTINNDYLQMYWMLGTYDDWMNYSKGKSYLDYDTEEFNIGNFIYINRDKNNIFGFDCNADDKFMKIDGYYWRSLKMMHADNLTISFYTNNIEVTINSEYVTEEGDIIYIYSSNVIDNPINNTIYLTTIK